MLTTSTRALVRRQIQGLITIPLLVLLAACDHSPPVAPGDNHTNQPFQPARITIATTNDFGPAWRLDGKGIVYSFETVDSDRHDRCLGLLPETGGRLKWRLCEGSGSNQDSTDLYDWPAPHRDGRVAFVHLRGSNLPLPFSGWIRLADLTDPGINRPLTPFPIVGDSGQEYPSASQLHWLDDDRLVFAAEKLRLLPTGWIAVGSRLMLLNIDDGPPVPLPDTDFGSSVILMGGDTLYFTRSGSAGLYRHILSSGTSTLLHTFSDGIARDLVPVNHRIAAVVGGNINFIPDQPTSPIQADSGGNLVLFDPALGTEVSVDLGGMLIRRPAVAPGGTRLVVERHGGSGPAAPSVDLWLVSLP